MTVRIVFIRGVMNGWAAQNASYLVFVVLTGAVWVGLRFWLHRRQDRADRQLREQAELRRLLFDQAPGGVVLSDLQFHFIEVNRAFCQMTGYARDELLGLSIPEITHPDDRAKSVESRQRVARGEDESVLLEKRYIRKDGTVLEVMVSIGLIQNEQGAPQYFVGHIADITGRRRAESELQIRQQQLTTILENVPIILFAVDTAGIFTLSEGAGLAILDRRPGEAVGRSIYDRYAQRPDILADVRRGLAGETFAVQRESRNAFFEIHYTPLRDAGGNVSGMIGIAIDVTAREKAGRERKKLERQLIDMQKLESLGVLAGGVAHDFNNLLTAMMGNASLARLAVGETSPAIANLEQIEQASRAAANLCHQLLMYSGRGRLETREIVLDDFIRDMADRLQLAAGSRVSLRYELAPDLPTVAADPAQLRQVLVNLVLNAAETLSRDDGVVKIITRLQAVDSAWLAEASVGREIRPGEYVGLEISDNGPGLSPETQARLFDPFFASKARDRGLGLPAALGIMRSHQGALKLSSQPGQGTTFTLVFPPHARPAKKEPSAVDRWRGHGQVLIVDDEETVRATAAQMTAYYGFDVRQASSGEQALDIVRQSPEPFDLVLLDLTMPGMDGFATFSALRQLRPDLRIVVFSGYSERDAQQRFAGKNLTGFLQKPFSADALREILRLACPD